MASHSRIINLTNGFRIKRSQALGRIEQCISEWVEEGVSIRDLTLAQRVARRAQQSKEREPLAFVELPNVVYRPPIGAQAAYYESKRLAFEANRFASELPQ
jgi:hypothetical protein